MIRSAVAGPGWLLPAVLQWAGPGPAKRPALPPALGRRFKPQNGANQPGYEHVCRDRASVVMHVAPLRRLPTRLAWAALARRLQPSMLADCSKGAAARCALAASLPAWGHRHPSAEAALSSRLRPLVHAPGAKRLSCATSLVVRRRAPVYLPVCAAQRQQMTARRAVAIVGRVGRRALHPLGHSGPLCSGDGTVTLRVPCPLCEWAQCFKCASCAAKLTQPLVKAYFGVRAEAVGSG